MYLLILLLVSLIFVVIFFAEYAVNFTDCKHTHWAQYQSKKCRVCIECGKIEPINTIW